MNRDRFAPESADRSTQPPVGPRGRRRRPPAERSAAPTMSPSDDGSHNSAGCATSHWPTRRITTCAPLSHQANGSMAARLECAQRPKSRGFSSPGAKRLGRSTNSQREIGDQMQNAPRTLTVAASGGHLLAAAVDGLQSAVNYCAGRGFGGRSRRGRAENDIICRWLRAKVVCLGPSARIPRNSDRSRPPP